MSLILGKCENEIIQFAVTYLKRTLSYSIVSQYFHDLIVNSPPFRENLVPRCLVQTLCQVANLEH